MSLESPSRVQTGISGTSASRFLESGRPERGVKRLGCRIWVDRLMFYDIMRALAQPNNPVDCDSYVCPIK